MSYRPATDDTQLLLPEYYRNELQGASSICPAEEKVAVTVVFVTKRAKAVPEDFRGLLGTDSMHGELLFVEFEIELFRIKPSPVDHQLILLTKIVAPADHDHGPDRIRAEQFRFAS
jgi:hypothetical protein